MEAPGDARRLQFKIRGMDCAEEIALLKREVGPLAGGEEHLAFDLLKAKMTVLSPDRRVGEREIVRAVERAGMKAQVWEDDPGHLRPERFWTRRGRTVLTAVSGAAALAGFGVHAAAPPLRSPGEPPAATPPSKSPTSP